MIASDAPPPHRLRVAGCGGSTFDARFNAIGQQQH